MLISKTSLFSGRIFFDNMKKAITYVLVSNVAELLPFLTYVALNIPLALATVTMLCISVGTDFVSSFLSLHLRVMKNRPYF